jgi:glycosyltransferase involved in cell wall biosynthesis
MRERLVRLGVAKEQVFMLPRGIALDMIKPRRISNGALRVVCTRRFSKIFHHKMLLQACGLLRDRGVPFRLNFCGSGPEEFSIRNLVRDLGLVEEVTFLGELAYADVLNLLADSDVAVSLSSKDGASASLFESMAAGCYPVVSRIPANEVWISDGENGRLVTLGDIDGLADVLTNLANDRDELKRGSEVNRTMARGALDIRINTHRYIEFFASIVREEAASVRQDVRDVESGLFCEREGNESSDCSKFVRG